MTKSTGISRHPRFAKWKVFFASTLAAPLLFHGVADAQRAPTAQSPAFRIGTANINDPIVPVAAVETGTELAAEGIDEENLRRQRDTFDVTYRFSTSVTYDDNIFISEFVKTDDVIFTIGAGVNVDLGDQSENAFLSLDFGVDGVLYVENPAQDGVNLGASLLGGYAWPKTTLTIATDFQYLTGADRQIGDFADRFVIPFSLTLTHDYSDKTSFGGTIDTSFDIYDQFQDSSDVSAGLFVDYQITGKTRLGLGAEFGFTDQQDGNSSTYQDLLLRVGYEATGKLDFFTTFGPQFRQFNGSFAANDEVNFVMTLGSTWRPRQNTTVSLQAYRSFIASASTIDQAYYATGVDVSVQQILFSKVAATLTGGFENDDYQGTTIFTGTNRDENYWFIRPSLSYAFTRFASVGIFYEYRENDSNIIGSSFTNNRVGLEGTLSF